MKAHLVGLSIDFAKKAVVFLLLKQTWLLLNLNIFRQWLKLQGRAIEAVLWMLSGNFMTKKENMQN